MVPKDSPELENREFFETEQGVSEAEQGVGAAFREGGETREGRNLSEPTSPPLLLFQPLANDFAMPGAVVAGEMSAMHNAYRQIV